MSVLGAAETPMGSNFATPSDEHLQVLKDLLQVTREIKSGQDELLNIVAGLQASMNGLQDSVDGLRKSNS